MFKSDINALTLVTAVAAASIAHLVTDAGWTTLVAGLLLTIVLLAFSTGERSFFQSVAFGGVTGYCLAVAVLGGIAISKNVWTLQWQFALWLGLTAVFLIIDRVGASAPSSSGLLTTSVPPVSLPNSVPSASAVPTRTSPAPATGKAIELPPNAGKPATIYLNIVDTAVACLRPVQAEHLGRDFYRIVETAPADEKWEFTTGQIVRCQKRTLSSGKAMVAVEEAPRADKL